MSFDFSTLVTNRSSSDVAYVRQLVERFVAGTATDEDREAWNSIALKGAYNHTDLNRVNAAMSAINEMLVNAGYKTAYKKFNIPRPNYYGDVYLHADSVISGDDYDTYIFVAPGTGTFVCKVELDGVTKEQAVTVSENTQYTVDLAREQLVHYTMLYDSGDECTALTGGWERYGYNSGVFQKNSNHIYATGVGNSKNTNGFGTTNLVSTSGNSRLNFIIKVGREEIDTNRNTYATCWNVRATDFKSDGIYENGWAGNYSVATDGTDNQYNDTANHVASWLEIPKLLSADITGFSNFYPSCIYANWWKNYTFPFTMYSAFMTEADDWQTLADKAGIAASSMADLIANAETLLSNNRAVEFMVYNCTGDFMVSALQSSTFLSELESSDNKNIVYENKHWAKFLNLLS